MSAVGVLGLSIIVSNQTSLAESGLFFSAFATAMGFSIFLQIAQPTILIRKIAKLLKEEESTGVVYGTSFVTILSVTTGMCLILFIINIAHYERTTPLSLVWLPLLPMTVLNILAAFFKSKGWAGLGGFLETGLISSCACIWFLVMPAASGLQAWLYFSLIAWIILIFACLGVLPNIRVDWIQMRPSAALLWEARSLWSIAILSYISQWGGVILISFMIGDEAVAVSNALLRLLAPLQFVILTLDFYLAPKLTTAESWRDVQRLRWFGILIGLALAAPYAVILGSQPDAVMIILFGAEYQGYGAELRVLIVASLLQISMGANGILLNMRGLDFISLIGVVGRFLGTLVLSVIFIPFLGIMGVILTFSVTLILQNLYYRLAVRKIMLNVRCSAP